MATDTHEPTEAELDALIAKQRQNLPGWWDGTRTKESTGPLTPILPPGQLRAYLAIVQLYDETGGRVDRRSLSARIGCSSPNAAHCHIEVLERKGFIRREPKTAGGIVPLWRVELFV